MEEQERRDLLGELRTAHSIADESIYQIRRSLAILKSIEIFKDKPEELVEIVIAHLEVYLENVE